MNTKELIEAVKNERGSAFQNCNDCEYGTHNCEVIEKLNRLAELEDKIEQGTLIELPCKVGDTVYQTDGEIIYEITINRIIYDTENIAFDETAIGKMIFLSKEAAEARLKELQEEKK